MERVFVVVHCLFILNNFLFFFFLTFPSSFLLLASSSLTLSLSLLAQGAAFAMRLQAERSYASQCGGRLPGMDGAPSSNALLNSLTGADMTIGFEDILNLPETRPIAPKVVLHAAMEIKLGL